MCNYIIVELHQYISVIYMFQIILDIKVIFNCNDPIWEILLGFIILILLGFIILIYIGFIILISLGFLR